ncbi:MAG: DUF1565 domain-containing protein [Planctomycetes bacterium]|nr:DUF1565 domain-containing protein [Planctomycetota bacterium]
MSQLPCLSGVLLMLFFSSQLLATEYVVSPDGNDDAPGTREKPWKTIAKANLSLKPGDTVTFLDGKYAGVIEPVQSGKEKAPITFRSQNHLGAVLTGGKASDGKALCVWLNQKDHVVIEGFYMLPDTGGWMRLTSTKNCVIRKCEMENATKSYSPIECRDSHTNRYEDLVCRRSNNIGKYGHVAGDMWNNYGSTHNVFLRIHISRAGHRPFGIWYDSPYNVVRDCIFDCRWGRNFEYFSAPRILMEGCIVTNGFDGAGSADGRAKLFIVDSIFRRNVIYRNYYGPLVINAYQWRGHEKIFEMTRSRIYHNTWFRNHEYGFQMSDNGKWEEAGRHFVAGNIFQNNIFAGNDPGGDGLALFLQSNIAEDNLFRFNDLFGDKPGCKTVRYDSKGWNVNRWDDLRMTATEANARMPKQFIGNIDADPLFASADADDYRLRDGSPCIDAGKPLAVAREAGQGRTMPVDDARWFYDGFGIPGEQGDLIVIGSEKKKARVVKADIEKNVLTLDRDTTWAKGDSIALPYAGKAPDLGAYESGMETGPTIPKGLRLVTMETATKPVVVTDFEPENMEEWHYYWNFSRQRNTDARMDDTTAASGKRSMRIFATSDKADLSCDIRPRWWDIDRFPIVKFSYRIPKGVPVGVWLCAFKSSTTGRGMVCVGGTETRKAGGYTDLKRYTLIDDDQWHEITIDARVIREVYPKVKLLQMFRFYTMGKGEKGQHFWFDNFRILPAGSTE